ncbi:MAG TPA: SurA N-terminal domain-containing protein [Pyrinomonadaceae bacterium]|nr:SurA N-terminal domain-containing protein [Pyrinomonadaceae bacterium]
MSNFRILTTTVLMAAAVLIGACGGGPSSTSTSLTNVDPNETAATINGKVVKMEDVERAVKQQAQGQESKLSPLELAGARLQVLQGLIEQEVMFQKAEKEGVVPKDEDVATEINKQKVGSGLSAEEFDRQMTQAGLSEASYRDQVKRGMAIKALVDKITGRIETPRDNEIEAFFRGNPEMFVKKRGVQLAAIVVDPSNSGQGDTTTDAASGDLKVKEILGKLQQPGSDFAALAREYSEDPSKFKGGDLGFFSEEELRQSYPQLVEGFMNPSFQVGRITNVVPISGKGYIFKLQDRVEKEENLTLESPQVRPQINEMLVNNRKQLLAASYQAIAMNEAKIENFLARKVVENPNELSGARPAATANSNAAPAANTNNAAPAANVTAPANSNIGSNAAKPASPAANAARPASPAANAARPPAPASNANAGGRQ